MRIVAGLLLVAGAVTGIVWRQSLDIEVIRAWIAAQGLVAPVVFILIYGASMIVLFPATVLSLASGAVFGWAGGVVCNLAGSTLGATLTFLVARGLGAREIQRAFGPRGRTLMEGVEAEGWRFVVFVRMVVIIPFNISNYLFGVTRIRVGPYAAATALGMLPGCIAYSYLGFAIGEAMTDGPGQSQIDRGLLALMLLVLVALIPRWLMTRGVKTWSRDALVAALASDTPPLVLDLRPTEHADHPDSGIPGAVRLPASQLRSRIAELGEATGHAVPVVLVTAHGGYAVRVLRTLRAAGFRQIVVLRGGHERWVRDAREDVAQEPRA